ncbi:hypothetical protein IW261DRAFT_1575077 [Armillaria novae-zelandiae]|uniref:Ribonuclease H1 N-terminal domain-containing protein n=1 Tax=Armillaria novae-zelandiae TaxID=153914 RepID=A0AA39NFU0_9AGAR|nr:hypothetical protein IW261DRAFT_1575077 [Armillaria novae-zelandiae]
MVTKTTENTPATFTAAQLAQIVQALQEMGLITPGTNTSGGSTPANPARNGDNILPSQCGGGSRSPGGGSMAAFAITATISHQIPTAKNEITFATPTASLTPKIRTVLSTPLGQGEHAPAPSVTPSPQTRRSTMPWYTVTVGYEVGVFQGWNIVAPLVLRVSSPVYQHHPSRASALTHYAEALENGDVKIVPRDED